MRNMYQGYLIKDKISKSVFVLLVFMLLAPLSLFAQSRVIKGVVKDSKSNDPLIGCSVAVKGSSTGTLTDLNGEFTLGASSKATLVFTFVGYNKKEVVIGDQNNITVLLDENSKVLEEVVVVGYGTVQRKNFTGSVSQIKLENSPLALIPTSNALDALRGTITGLNVSQEQGAGQSPSLLVRGQKSVNGGTDPLIVLDGVIFMGEMRDIDPATIENISVLKDATSVAAYGSRAANGVVMITTKKGKNGKPVVNFNASLAISQVAIKPDVLSPSDYIKKVNLLQGLSENADPTSWMSDFERTNYAAGKTTDWFDLSTRTGLMQNYSASISGANDKTNYYVAATHTDQQGVVKGDDYTREAFTSRIKTDITNWLEIGGDANYSFNDYSGPTNYDLYQAIRLTPYGRAYRDNGSLEKYPRQEGIYMTNPLWNIESGTIDDKDTYSTYMLRGHEYALKAVP